jgi:polar amino acid transport system substrate-binding protein
MVRFLPWSRAIAGLAAGQVDASYAWSKTDEREVQFHYSEPFFETRNVFFYRKGFPFDWATVSDLSAFRVGGVQDYAYSDELLEAEKSGAIKVIRVVSERQLVLLLMAGRIDAFPAEEMVGRELFKEYAPGRMNDFSVHQKALQKRALYVIARKTDPGKALLEHFNQGLNMLKVSGRYQNILNHSSTASITSSEVR